MSVLSPAAAAAAAASGNPHSMKTLLATGLSKFIIKDNPVFSNGPRGLPGNRPDWANDENWVFHNFITRWIIRESFTKPWNLSSKLMKDLKLLQYHFHS